MNKLIAYLKYVFCKHEWGDRYDVVSDNPTHFQYTYEFHGRDCEKCLGTMEYKFSTFEADYTSYVHCYFNWRQK